MEENKIFNSRKISENNDVNLITLNRLQKIQSLLKKESALKELCKLISYIFLFSYKCKR